MNTRADVPRYTYLSSHDKKNFKPINLIFGTCQKLQMQEIYLQKILWCSIDIDTIQSIMEK